MSKKHKKVFRVLQYIEHLLILVSSVTGLVSIFAFASLVGIPVGIPSSAVRSKICVITAGIKKCKSIIQKKKKKQDKIVLLAKSKLNSTEILIFEAFDSNIIHNEFALINNAQKESDFKKRNQKFRNLNRQPNILWYS